MDFKNRRYVTCGVNENVPLMLQLFLWQCIDKLPPGKDRLQVFKLSADDGKQKIIHIQELPEYQKEYLIRSDTPFFIGKIYAIDDETHSTMLLAEEY